jgi:hypothetical protein
MRLEWVHDCLKERKTKKKTQRVRERKEREERKKKINPTNSPPATKKQISNKQRLYQLHFSSLKFRPKATNSMPKCIHVPPKQTCLHFQGSGGKMAYSGLCTVLSPLTHRSTYDVLKKLTSSLTKHEHNTFPTIQPFI